MESRNEVDCQETRRTGWRRDILKIATAEAIYSMWQTRKDTIFVKTPIDSDLKN